MGTHNIRLGSMLSFDEDQEKDIIKVMEYLNATHSMGKFISNLIRIALDNPEILDVKDGKFEKGAIIKQLETLGVSYNRNAFFTNLAKEVDVMKKKVDKVYDMSMKTYMLAQMGKHLGLESKSDNSLLAGFVLEKQLTELQNTLGINLSQVPFESNKLDVVHKRAEDALEYIIETYDSLLNELKNNIDIKPIEIPVSTAVVASSIDTSANVNVEYSPVKENETIVKPETNSDSEEIIDFGNAFEMNDSLLDFFSTAK